MANRNMGTADQGEERRRCQARSQQHPCNPFSPLLQQPGPSAADSSTVAEGFRIMELFRMGKTLQIMELTINPALPSPVLNLSDTSALLLNPSRGGDSDTSLGSLFPCLTTISSFLGRNFSLHPIQISSGAT